MSEIMQITGNTDNIAYQHPHDAGADLKSREDTIIPANGRTLVHTGVYAAIPHNQWASYAPEAASR